MPKFITHGFPLNYVVLDAAVPTLATPYIDIPQFIREAVMPKCDFRKKWCGCWMYKTGHERSGDGEPRFSYMDEERKSGRKRRRRRFFKTAIASEFVRGRDGKRRVYDFNVHHLCGNIDCLNPAHLVADFGEHKHIDLEKLRREFLAPGTYYTP